MPSVARIFFAIDFPEPVRTALARFIGELKKQAKSKSIRWSKPDNLHITLQFMPEVRIEHLEGMAKYVRAELAAAVHKLTFSFGSIHLFPSPYRPRVIVLDILPQEPLMGLSQCVGRGITAMQYDIESRPFRAHLTLGRIKHQDVKLDFLSSIKAPAIGELVVEDVVLFRSEPHEDGSHYTVLERISLSHP